MSIYSNFVTCEQTLSVHWRINRLVEKWAWRFDFDVYQPVTCNLTLKNLSRSLRAFCYQGKIRNILLPHPHPPKKKKNRNCAWKVFFYSITFMRVFWRNSTIVVLQCYEHPAIALSLLYHRYIFVHKRLNHSLSYDRLDTYTCVVLLLSLVYTYGQYHRFFVPFKNGLKCGTHVAVSTYRQKDQRCHSQKNGDFDGTCKRGLMGYSHCTEPERDRINGF